MLNLLPAEEKKYIRKDFLKRAAVEALGVLMFVVICGIGFLVPSYLVLKTEIDSFASELNSLEDQFDNSELTALREQVKKQNAEISRIVDAFDVMPLYSVVLADLLERQTNGVSILSFSIQKEGEQIIMHIAGESLDRDHLVAFAESLRESRYVEVVSVPEINFIDATNLAYRISLVISDDKLPTP
jgi:hypothetical protein